MDRSLTITGALLAGLGVALGAFAAHGLKDSLDADAMRVFETGVRYHLVSALGILAAAVACRHFPGRACRLGGWLLFGGVVLFSGSLYLLAVTGIAKLGMITPFGGILFLIGWGALAFGAWRGRGGSAQEAGTR